MRAIRMKSYGGPEVLCLEQIPAPVPGPDDVRVAVHATSVNPVDFKIRSGGQRAVAPGLPEFTEKYGSVLGLVVFGGWMAGVMLRARVPRGVKVQLVTRAASGQKLSEVMRLVDAGALTPLIDRVYPLEEAAAAHRYLETGRAKGKVVLSVRAQPPLHENGRST